MDIRSPGAVEALARGCNWLTYIVLPLFLVPEEFGKFSLLLAIVLLASSVGTAGQDRVILRYATTKTLADSRLRIGIGFLLAAAFSLSVFFIAYQLLLIFDLIQQFSLSFGWVVLWGVMQTFYLLLMAVCRALEQNQAFVILRLIYSATKLGCLLLIAANTSAIDWLVKFEALWLTTIVILVAIKLRHFFGRPVKSAVWKKSLIFGLPLVLHIMAGAMLGQVDKLMLASMVDNSALGIYAFINSMAGGVFFIFAIVNIIYEAKVYQMGDTAEANNLMGKMLKVNLLLAGGALLLVNLVLPFLLDMLNRSAYYDQSTLFILSFAYLLYPLYLQSNVRFALKEKTQYIPMITGVAALVNIMSNVLLIPQFGIAGAAMSTLIAYIVLLGLAQRVSRKV